MRDAGNGLKGSAVQGHGASGRTRAVRAAAVLLLLALFLWAPDGAGILPDRAGSQTGANLLTENAGNQTGGANFLPGNAGLLTVYAAADSEACVIDGAGLFDGSEKEDLEERIRSMREETKMDLLVLTIADAEGKSGQEYADDYYDEHSGGKRQNGGWALILIDMDNREIALSAAGQMSRYLTDERTGRILDSALLEIQNNGFAAGAAAAVDGIRGFVEAGIVEGQYNYDPETGRSDYYRKRAVTWYEFLFALAAAGALAILPCVSTVNKYKMKAEHRQALGFHMAYRADSAFAFRAVNDLLINRAVTQRRIETRGPGGPGGGPSGGMGSGTSGRTTMHRSSSGRMHSGGSRKF